MTFNASLLAPSANPFQIRYVDASRDASSVRRHRLAIAARRVAIATVAGAAIVAAAIGVANAATVNSDGEVHTDPVRGEYRLGPGNITPPGYVIPLDARPGLSGRVPSEFAPQWRPSLIPADGGVSLVMPKSSDLLFAPKPPGRVATV